MAQPEIRETTFFILASLASRPQHGYAIMSDVNEMSEGRVIIRAGTLYTALDRLLAEGLIEERGTEVVEGRRRRYYAVTEMGAQVLEGEVERLRSNARHAAGRLRARDARI